jgi:hypothetical protein
MTVIRKDLLGDLIDSAKVGMNEQTLLDSIQEKRVALAELTYTLFALVVNFRTSGKIISDNDSKFGPKA